MQTYHAVIVGLLAAIAPAALQAQSVVLTESPRAGECFDITVATNVTGTLKLVRESKEVPIKVAAENKHQFTERILRVGNALPQRNARHYRAAEARATIDGDRVERTLSAERRLILAQRHNDALLCFSPAGPLTRHEVEVVSEHFDTLQLTGVLPGKEVHVGARWKIDNTVVQAICLLDGLISHDLNATLKEVAGDIAVIAIEGAAKGIEHGALANLVVSATVRFDRASKRIVALEWKQKDVRDQGPVSPAGEFESVTTLTRKFIDSAPAELSSTIVEGLPNGTEPPATSLHVLYRDPRGRFQLVHAREWQTVGQTDYHLILRLMDRGDFVAQATLTNWKNVGPGRHMSEQEFEKLIGEGKGWKLEQILERSEVPTDNGRWVYRIVARGELDNHKVVQGFYVLASAAGEQMIITFTMKPDAAERLGTRDMALVNALDFAKR